jgi:hypothetical protein
LGKKRKPRPNLGGCDISTAIGYGPEPIVESLSFHPDHAGIRAKMQYQSGEAVRIKHTAWQYLANKSRGV